MLIINRYHQVNSIVHLNDSVDKFKEISNEIPTNYQLSRPV